MYGFFYDSDNLYYVLELFEGEELYEYLYLHEFKSKSSSNIYEENFPNTPESLAIKTKEKLFILEQILYALDYLHQRNIIHRYF